MISAPAVIRAESSAPPSHYEGRRRSLKRNCQGRDAEHLAGDENLDTGNRIVDLSGQPPGLGGPQLETRVETRRPPTTNARRLQRPDPPYALVGLPADEDEVTLAEQGGVFARGLSSLTGLAGLQGQRAHPREKLDRAFQTETSRSRRGGQPWVPSR